MKKLFKNEEGIILEKGGVLATYNEVLEQQAAAGDISEGIYIVEDGVIEVCGSEEDYEIIFIENKIGKNYVQEIAS